MFDPEFLSILAVCLAILMSIVRMIADFPRFVRSARKLCAAATAQIQRAKRWLSRMITARTHGAKRWLSLMTAARSRSPDDQGRPSSG